MTAHEMELRYRLATTAVQFNGTITTTEAKGAAPKVHRDGAATVIVRADTTGMAVLDLADTGVADRATTLSFTPDGRLTGASETVTGVGTTVVAAAATVVGVVAEVGKVIGVVDMRPTGGTTAAPPDQLVAVRDAERRTVDALVDATGRIAAGVATTGTELADIDKALQLLSAQRARLEAEHAAAVGAATTVRTETYSAVLDAGQLPTADELAGGQAALTHAGHDAALEVWKQLGLCATLPRVADEQAAARDGRAPFQDGAEHRLWYRRPRRSRLSVWRAGDGGKPELVGSYDIDVLDAHCEHTGLLLAQGGFFGSDSLTATMAADGTLASLGETSKAAVGQVAGALASVAGGVGGGVKDASGVVSALASPSPEAVALAQLTATRDRLKIEQEIAQLRAGR